MQGADLAAVQRIMRHQDPRTTTEFYGHLAGHYLKREMERLSFGPPPGEVPTSQPHLPQEPRISLVAGGAPEPPLPVAHCLVGRRAPIVRGAAEGVNRQRQESALGSSEAQPRA